jgi:AcrR family transcriptional regulator
MATMTSPADAAPDAAPDVRRRLVEEAARLLGEEGPSALTTRRLAAGARTSTMAVYTHFGGMPALVREVAAEGFRRLIAHVDRVEPTDDPVADLGRMAAEYRANARENPHLYAVMFGSASLGGYRPHDGDLEEGRAAFEQLVAGVRRAMQAGALRDDDPAQVAGQFWAALHGYTMLELAHMQHVVPDPEHQLLWPMLGHLLEAHRP